MSTQSQEELLNKQHIFHKILILSYHLLLPFSFEPPFIQLLLSQSCISFWHFSFQIDALFNDSKDLCGLSLSFSGQQFPLCFFSLFFTLRVSVAFLLMSNTFSFSLFSLSFSLSFVSLHILFASSILSLIAVRPIDTSSNSMP